MGDEWVEYGEIQNAFAFFSANTLVGLIIILYNRVKVDIVFGTWDHLIRFMFVCSKADRILISIMGVIFFMRWSFRVYFLWFDITRAEQNIPLWWINLG